MNAFSSSTMYRAHASAAAAVLHLAGGRPDPKARRTPSVETTAMPKPVALQGLMLPCSSEPSQYQVASVRSGLSHGGGRCHSKCACLRGGGMDALTNSKPLVRRMRFLSADNFLYRASVLGGGGVMLHASRVARHTCRCSRVPMSSKHSWHLRSSILKAGTAAFRTWGHWPPLMADAASAFHAFFQGCANLLAFGLLNNALKR